jgi:hypothetical protein
MKTKKALGGLLGLFGSLSALDFLTESLESAPLDLALDFISEPSGRIGTWVCVFARAPRDE